MLNETLLRSYFHGERRIDVGLVGADGVFAVLTNVRWVVRGGQVAAVLAWPVFPDGARFRAIALLDGQNVVDSYPFASEVTVPPGGEFTDDFAVSIG